MLPYKMYSVKETCLHVPPIKTRSSSAYPTKDLLDLLDYPHCLGENQRVSTFRIS